MEVELQTIEGGLALLTLPSTGHSNALTGSSMDAIIDTLQALNDDPNIRAVILTGKGRIFCTGADIDAIKESLDEGNIESHVRHLTDRLHPMLIKMASSSTVYVAAVNGSAAGGGLGLALACDFRISTADARIGSAYFSIGLSPDGGSTYFLPRLIGMSTTRRFLFEKEVLTGSEAYAYGLVDEIVEPEFLLQHSVKKAKLWSQHPPHLVQATKSLLRSTWDVDMGEQLSREQSLIVASASNPHFEKCVKAFLGRRKNKS